MGLISKHGILMWKWPTSFSSKANRSGTRSSRGDPAAAAHPHDHGSHGARRRCRSSSPPARAPPSRYNLGLVIATGLAIGTLFTLYVVPAAYVLIGRTHHKEAGTRRLRPRRTRPNTAQ